MQDYDIGKDRILSKIAEDLYIDLYTVERMYWMLNDAGLIDYDIEKEVFQQEAERSRNDNN